MKSEYFIEIYKPKNENNDFERLINKYNPICLSNSIKNNENGECYIMILKTEENLVIDILNKRFSSLVISKLEKL